MRKGLKLLGLSLFAGLFAVGLSTVTTLGGGKGEVKLVFSSSTHGLVEPCG